MARNPRTPVSDAGPQATTRSGVTRSGVIQADAAVNNTANIPAGGPAFAQPGPTADPTTFLVQHLADTEAYRILDAQQKSGGLNPLSFPVSRGGTEPILKLADTLGHDGAAAEREIIAAGIIVFHSVGDTGNTRGPDPQNQVADKMLADFDDADQTRHPRFYFHLGDVIYNFGEARYYYDQFYDPYRDYPAPIVALAGNHDGMVAPNTDVPPLDAFLRNFCAESFMLTPESGGLDRTAGVQPGVYFTFEAPLVRIIALYSGTLEDPGVISSQDGRFPNLPDIQLDFLHAALKRVADEEYLGALIIAHHHPIYTAGAKHGWSPTVREQVDAICQETGVWPHAVLSAHAHNYQRFTRMLDGRETPYIIAGNGGHGLAHLARRGTTAVRAPMMLDTTQAEGQVQLENYDDQDYGYLRIVVTPAQLRIEYHPASDGGAAKTPDDSVTINLATRQITHFADAVPVAAAEPATPAPPHRSRAKTQRIA